MNLLLNHIGFVSAEYFPGWDMTDPADHTNMIAKQTTTMIKNYPGLPARYHGLQVVWNLTNSYKF